MKRFKTKKLIVPTVAVVVLGLLASLVGAFAVQIPDGFEWVVFIFAGLTEPQPTEAGIWSFLGQGPVVKAIAGMLGVMLTFFVGHAAFKALSGKTRSITAIDREEVCQ